MRAHCRFNRATAIVLAALTAATAGVLTAQIATGRMSGTVSDSATGLPIAGVQISATATPTSRSYYSVTDRSGKYVLSGLPIGAQQVTARRVGYAVAHRTVVIDTVNEARAEFVLAPAAISLEAIVVTGMVSASRGGRVVVDTAGLRVVATAPGVSEGFATKIRSVNSVSAAGVLHARASEPLYVLDGVPIASTRLGGDTSRSAVQRIYSFNAIDPGEIASIEVLKGTAAASIYGSEAAYGVISIETKRPSRTRAMGAPRNGLVRTRTLEQIEVAIEREKRRVLRGDSLASLGRDSVTPMVHCSPSSSKPSAVSEVQKFICEYYGFTRGYEGFLEIQADVLAKDGRTAVERVRRAYIGRANRLSSYSSRAELLFASPGVKEEERRDLDSTKNVGHAQETELRSRIDSLPPGTVGSGLLPVHINSWVEATCFWRQAQPTFLPGLNLNAGNHRAAVGANVVDGFLGGVRASFGVGMAASDNLDSVKANLQRLVSAGGSFVFGFSYPLLHLAPGEISCDSKDHTSRNQGFDVLLWPRFGIDAPIAGTQVASGVWNADLGVEINAFAGTQKREIVFLFSLRASVVDGPTAFHRTIGRTTADAFGYAEISLGAEVADVLRIQYRWPVATPSELKSQLTSFVSFSISPRVTGTRP